MTKEKKPEYSVLFSMISISFVLNDSKLISSLISKMPLRTQSLITDV
ncbi:hypothetical protein JCM19233_4077 [Vibrio astriarenae]|nr:hypothetical protein JCM19233_4077 [Vibrio sp. C7]